MSIPAPPSGPPGGGALFSETLSGRSTGQQRFEELMRVAPTDNADAYDNWILSIPEDPKDILFTMLLREEKARVREAQFKRAPSFGRPEGENDGPTIGDQGQAKRAGKEIDVKADEPLKAFYQQEPIIKGAPMGTGEILQSEMEAGLNPETGKPAKDYFPSEGEKEQDPLLREFSKRQGLTLSRPTEEALVATGDYVYVGTEKDKMGFQRPVYVYKDDAKASIVKWGSNKIKQIQKRLGLPTTGVPDKDLLQLWDDAVQLAGERYAKAGLKVTPEFIFETWVKMIEAELAKNGRGGGGGGGGAGGPGLTEDDYYMAMMGVMGDISGVQDGGLGG
jgi:hypothetical protein